MIKFTIYLLLLFVSLACKSTGSNNTEEQTIESVQQDSIGPPVTENTAPDNIQLNLNEGVKGVKSYELVDFAKTLIGVPYLYASTDPSKGFDCSGFITHVFNHFNIAVPRSSKDFTNVGKEVDIPAAKEGDLILFTGTVDSIRIVGHMGIVTENADTLKFIHSSSGKANGVTISSLNEHYKKRFVKITRVLAE